MGVRTLPLGATYSHSIYRASLVPHSKIGSLLRPLWGAKYCDQYVCLSVCLFVCLYGRICKTARANFLYVTCGYGTGWVLLWRQLKILKRSKLSFADYNGTTIWPLHRATELTLQKRAIRIILHPLTLPYDTALVYYEIELRNCEEITFRKIFLNRFVSLRTASITSCHRNVIPLSVRLQHNKVYAIPHLRTKQCCSFINHALQNYH